MIQLNIQPNLLPDFELGNKLSVLGGDYLLAKVTVMLSQLENSVVSCFHRCIDFRKYLYAIYYYLVMFSFLLPINLFNNITNIDKVFLFYKGLRADGWCC